jgi:hypothetical protein
MRERTRRASEHVENSRPRIVSEGAPRARRTLRSYLLVLYAVVFAAFGLVVWFAWEETLGGSSEVRLVRAPDKPVKREPEDRGGLAVENKDAAVVRVFGDDPYAPRVERVLPRDEPPARAAVEADPSLAEPRQEVAAMPEPLRAPEEPLVSPPATASTPPEGEEGAVAADGEVPSVDQEPVQADQPEPGEGALPSDEGAFIPTPPPAKPEPASTTPAEPASQPAIREPTSQPPVQTQTAQPQRSAQPPAPATPSRAGPRELLARGSTPDNAGAAPAPRAPAAPATRTATTSPWRIQIAALGSADAVRGAWDRLRRSHPEVLAGLSLAVEEVTVGGTKFYRLQAAGFADRDAAARACAALKSAGRDCFVVGASS